MSRRRSLPLVAVLFAGLSAAGCGRSAGDTGVPWCDDYSVLVLAAQSVPEAQLIPCIEAMPIGWEAGRANIDERRTVFTLDSRIAGEEAARVELARECETDEHVQVPSDIPGAERFEFIESIETGVRGQRVYVFEGACVTIDVDFAVDVSAALISEISLAVGFVTRDEVNDSVRTATDGREQVDPPAGE